MPDEPPIGGSNATDCGDACPPGPNFSGSAPLFPLPNLVLVPGGEQILHVFEPRYRAMLAHAMAGERLIAMAVLDPRGLCDTDGTPRIGDVVGLGRVVEHQSLPEGRALILLKGLGRYRVVHEERHRPFRVARLEPVPTTCSDVELATRESVRLVERVAKSGCFTDAVHDQPLAAGERLGDLLLAQLPADAWVRQQVFAIPDLARRLVAIHRILDGFGAGQVPSQN
jgi:Lon protease-like protein